MFNLILDILIDIYVMVNIPYAWFTPPKQISPPRLVMKLKISESRGEFTEMNSQCSKVEKNTHAQKVQMQKN